MKKILPILTVLIVLVFLLIENNQLRTDLSELSSSVDGLDTKHEGRMLAYDSKLNKLAELVAVTQSQISYNEDNSSINSVVVEEKLDISDDDKAAEIPSMVIPSGFSECALRLGQVALMSYEIRERYSNGSASLDDEQHKQFAMEVDALMAEFTSVMLGMENLGFPDKWTPDAMADLLSEMYISSLNLEPEIGYNLRQILMNAYKSAEEMDLKISQKPKETIAAKEWAEQRKSLSLDTWKQIKPLISEGQQEMFIEMHALPSEFLFNIIAFKMPMSGSDAP